MTKKMTTTEGLASFAIVVIGSPIAFYLRGWALTYMWKWFIVPPFHLPELSVYHAVGLSFIVAILTKTREPDRLEEAEDTFLHKTVMGFIRSITFSPFMLGIAWVIHQFQ